MLHALFSEGVQLYTLGTCLLILTLWLAWWHWVSNQTNIGTLGQLQPSLYTVPGVLLPYQAFSTLAALWSQLLRESLTDTTKVPSVNSSHHCIHSARCLIAILSRAWYSSCTLVSAVKESLTDTMVTRSTLPSMPTVPKCIFNVRQTLR